ncbi:MAG: nucleoside recognition domain-containing protein [Desulfurivibrionaceae bacterium]|jgi:spore maturation protein SpmA|nr:spore maturation protein [Pseudomonadota bacterium]MBU4229458.1 spore maturation protein [Pseudomonadota bacterium]MBU4407119.1 spore maturation protein [Pseudomonadota bacterium]MDP2757804.1 nucleoside recognition domain-containing protein [Desulfurivibrionaceae bacterium]PKN21122.1 MAG: spore maturation protein [Deltaproteobacteria bacterium HGW-Deltaproteobacteria-3]
MQQKASVINIIWLSMVVLATVTAAYTNRMDALTSASFESAKDAVTLAIGLIGPMALWLGIMKVAEAGGLMRIVARRVRPLMVRLFPDVPHDHPAMSAMIMNMAANALGLGNAATPMGIKAMQELEKLAPEKGTATNAMCLFLAINTSSVTLLPLGVITIRAAAGAASPAAIFIPSLIATTCSTIAAIVAAKMLSRSNSPVELAPVQATQETAPAEAEACGEPELYPPGTAGKWFVWLLVAGFAGGAVYQLSNAEAPLALSAAGLNSLSSWLIPALISGLLIFGYLRGVRIYETLTDGAKEGFTTAMRIIPFMVAIFVAIGMFRASGAMDILVSVLSPVTSAVGMPAEALAMGLLRPLSGSGSFAFMSEIVQQSPDSIVAAMVSVIQGSSETTLYVLAVYFGAIGIRRTRHALPAALCGETVGLIAAVTVCNLWF